MNNLFYKIKAWFKSKEQSKSSKPKPTKPFNAKYYRKLIGKIASQAIAIQRARQRRLTC